MLEKLKNFKTGFFIRDNDRMVMRVYPYECQLFTRGELVKSYEGVMHRHHNAEAFIEVPYEHYESIKALKTYH